MHIFKEYNLMSLTYVYTCEIILIGNIMTILIKFPCTLYNVSYPPPNPIP